LSEALSKLTKISKYGGIFAKVLMAILVIGVVAGTVFFIAVALDASFLNEIIEEIVTETGISRGELSTAAAILTVCLLVIGALWIAILYHVDRLFTDIHRDNTPFTDDNARYLVIIAILVVVCAIVIPIMGYWAQTIDTAADSVYYQPYGFSILPLFVALLLYFLSLVFKYGAKLQKESDETL
jgi:hypothetical protein